MLLMITLFYFQRMCFFVFTSFNNPALKSPYSNYKFIYFCLLKIIFFFKGNVNLFLAVVGFLIMLYIVFHIFMISMVAFKTNYINRRHKHLLDSNMDYK